MPIRFRCNRCNRLLGIARRKAGCETTCPHCGATIVVPQSEPGDEERSQLDEIDDLLNPGASPVLAPAEAPAPIPAAAGGSEPRPIPAPPPPRPVPPPTPQSRPTPPRPVAPRTAPASVDDRPLFERDLDSVLGYPATTNGVETGKAKQSATAGMDAMSLEGDRPNLVITPQKATALVVVVVVLLALAFTAGFLIASR